MGTGAYDIKNSKNNYNIKIKSKKRGFKKISVPEISESLSSFPSDSKNKFQIRNLKELKIKVKRKEENLSMNEIYNSESNSYSENKNDKKENVLKKTKNYNLIDEEITKKNIQRQNLITNFLSEYNFVQNKFKQKQIKIIQAIGDNHLNQTDLEKIKKVNDDYNNNIKDQYIYNAKKNINISINVDIPIYNLKIKENFPKWNKKENNCSKLKELSKNRLVKLINKFIIRQRASRRLSKLLKFSKQYKKEKEKKKLIKSDIFFENFENFFEKKPFDFKLDENNIIKEKLPNELNHIYKNFEINFEEYPIVWSEDLSKIEKIPQNQLEINFYKSMNPFHNYVYQPLEFKYEKKSGAEEEYPYRREIREITNIEENYIDKSFQIKIPETKKNKKSENSPEIYNKTNYKEIEDKLKIDENIIFEDCPLLEFQNYSKNIINNFEQESEIENYSSLNNFTEVDNEKLLQFHVLNFTDPCTMDFYDNKKDLKNEYISISPGYQQLRVILNLELEKYNYFLHKYCFSKDIFLMEDINKYCPNIIEEIEKDDFIYLMENNGNKKKEEEKEIFDEKEVGKKEKKKGKNVKSKKKEKGDKNLEEEVKILDYHLENEEKIELINSVFEKHKEFCENFSNFKIKKMGELPTYYSDINKYIKNKKVKLYI